MTGFDQMDTGAAVSVDPLAVLGQLADMSAQEGYYGLQDANLVLLEAAREMQASRFDFASLLTDWTNHVSQYLTEPALAVPAIMGLLRRPDLGVPMADDEFAQLEAQLYEEAPLLDGAVGANLAVPPDTGLQTDALDWPAQLAWLDSLADQAAAKGWFGLQDANLLLSEALGALSPDYGMTELGVLMARWGELNVQYFCQPNATTPAIIQFLRNPALALPLDDEEFSMLAEQLSEVGERAHESPSTPAPVFDVEAQIARLGELADHAVALGLYGLQDANLLLADVLREIPPESLHEDLIVLMANWPALNDNYRTCPDQENITAIIHFLRHPYLDIPLDDDEFALLEGQLVCVAEGHDEMALPPQQDDGAMSLDTHMAHIGVLAHQAAAEGLYGLQDANLLLAEALAGLAPESINVSLLVLLDSWRELNARYVSQPGDATPLIVNFLRQPILQLALGDDELAELEAQLGAAGLSVPIVQELPAIDDPEDYPSLFSTGLPVADYAGGLPLLTQELVELLLLETSMVSDHIQAIVIGDSASVQSGLQQASEEMECFANAAKTAGFKGLSQICKHINLNLQYFYGHVQSFDADALELVQEWLSQVQEYLPAFNDSSASQLIVSGLTDDQWPVPLTFEQLSDILMQIHLESSSVVDESEAEHKQTVRLVKASDEDVSLALPDDVNQELLDILLEELPVYTQQFSEALQGMQAGNRAALDVAQRVAHTLKGSANTVGVRGIAELTHNLEDILIACAEEQKLPGQALSNALVNAADCLEGMSEALIGFGPPPDGSKAVLQDILDWANRIDKEGISGSEIANANIGDEMAPMLADAPEPAETAQAQTAMMRVPVGQIENLFRLSGENIILNGQAFETMRRMKQQLQAMQAQFANLQQLSAELEQLVDLKDLSGRALVADAVDFDALEMDQYNELHTASRRLIEAAVDAREMNLDAQKEWDQMNEVLDYQQQLMIDTQEAIMKTRLIPISTITPRLQRALRQTCRLTGKKPTVIIR
jgi:HPt (histidine-containing phosphotransfer) domain-containing protein